MNTRNRSKQRGSTIVEFAIVTPCLVMMFFGSVSLGIMLGRYVQVVQVARDIAHMYSDGVDFSQPTPRSIVTQKLAQGTGITDTGGNGVFILSKIETVYPADCTANAVAPCTNGSPTPLPVFTQRIVIGDVTARVSDFGTPTGMDASGNIAPATYMQTASLRAPAFETALDNAVQRATGTAPTPPAQAQGDLAYVVEVFIKYPDLGFLGWYTGGTAGGAYARFIFH